MAWLSVDSNGTENIFHHRPRTRYYGKWICYDEQNWREYGINLPKGSIKKLIGRDLTFEDVPIEIKED